MVLRFFVFFILCFTVINDSFLKQLQEKSVLFIHFTDYFYWKFRSSIVFNSNYNIINFDIILFMIFDSPNRNRSCWRSSFILFDFTVNKNKYFWLTCSINILFVFIGAAAGRVVSIFLFAMENVMFCSWCWQHELEHHEDIGTLPNMILHKNIDIDLFQRTSWNPL